MTPFHLTWLATCTVLIGVGCGGGTVTYQCDPTCPAGTHCLAGGCVADGTADDLAVAPTVDLVVGCSPACSGATPICDPTNQCVACLVDNDCGLGQRCGKIGTVAQCLSGCVDDSRCGAGMKCCGGSCTDPASDASNCGACDNACSVPHASSTCQSSACVLAACTPGWGNCNQDATDGCEVNLAVDAQNCGACGGMCSLPHAASACSNTCYLAACDFGWGDCNGDGGDGCEQSVLADLKNCGECGNSCPAAPHSSPACRNGACLLAACAQGWADCDGDPQNGCEVQSGTDKLNCGACGNECPMGLVCRNGGCTCPACNFPNAKSKCVNNVCALGACLPGFGDCNQVAKDGCEVDLTADANNCGACNNACPVNTPVCTDSVCNNQICNDIGYAQCPTGANQWCDVKAADPTNASQAKIACETCFFQQGMGQCQLSNGDCAGPGYSQFAMNGPTWGYTAGCSGAAGRVWEYGQSFTTYGFWAK